MAAQRDHRIYFCMVAVGVFLSTMDSSMVNIALPHILEDFQATLPQVEWVVLVYLLSISVFLLPWGKLSDRFGKGSVYLVGMLVFAVGSLSCSFSPSLGFLVISRFFQGFGAAMMMSSGPAIIRLAVPANRLGAWLGALGIATSMGLMSGPLVGGFVLHGFGWRTLFLINVPISFIVFIFGWIYLAGTLPRYRRSFAEFDWPGVVAWGVAVTTVVLLLNRHVITTAAATIPAVAVLSFAIVYLIRHERVCHDPLLPIPLLHERYYIVAVLTVLISFCVLFFVLILMPFYLKYIKELSPDRIGYMMMAVPLTLFVVSPLSGRLFDLIGARYLTVLGMLITASAVLLLSQITEHSSLLDIAWRLSLLGCGQSVFLSPNTASVLSRVSLEDTGVSAGMLATARNIGMLVGVALVGLLFSLFYGELTGGGDMRDYSPEFLPHFLSAFKHSLYGAAALASVGALLTLQRQ